MLSDSAEGAVCQCPSAGSALPEKEHLEQGFLWFCFEASLSTTSNIVLLEVLPLTLFCYDISVFLRDGPLFFVER